SFALMFTLVQFPLLGAVIPAMRPDLPGMAGLLLHELAVGLIIGAIVRITVMAAQVACSIVAFQTGRRGALAAGPAQAGVQGGVLGSFLSFLGIALIFATDLHHMALAPLDDS